MEKSNCVKKEKFCSQKSCHLIKGLSLFIGIYACSNPCYSSQCYHAFQENENSRRRKIQAKTWKVYMLQFYLSKISQSQSGDKNLKIVSVQNLCVLSLLCVCASVCMCFRVNAFSELADWRSM